MKNTLKFTIIFLFITVFAHGKSYRLIDGESPYTLSQWTLEGGLKAGYEKEYIKDYLIQTQLDIGLLRWFSIGGTLSYVMYPDQSTNKISEYLIRGRLRVYKKRRKFALFLFGKYRKSIGETILIPYEDGTGENLAVVSHRADGANDITGGITGKRDFSILGLLFHLDYTKMGSREYLPDEEDYKKIISVSITPAIYLNFFNKKRRYRRRGYRDNLMLGIQLKYSYGFAQGDLIEMIPQINWQFASSSMIILGGYIPSDQDKNYRYMIEFIHWL